MWLSSLHLGHVQSPWHGLYLVDCLDSSFMENSKNIVKKFSRESSMLSPIPLHKFLSFLTMSSPDPRIFKKRSPKVEVRSHSVFGSLPNWIYVILASRKEILSQKHTANF